MKKIIVFSILICAIAFMPSCKKKSKPGSASFTSEFDFTVDVAAQPDISTRDTTISVTSEISVDDDRLDNCDRASLKSFYLEIKAPANQTFDFCREAHLLLSAPGLPEIDVISAVNINPNAKRIDFTVNSTDLVQYVRQNSFTVKVRVVCMKGFSQPIKLYGNMVFNATGKFE
jgi:hypothetical protein